MPQTVNTGLTLGQRSGAKVQAKIGLSANNFTPLHELISTELVGFCANPGKFGPVPIVSRLHTRSIQNVMIGRMVPIQYPGNNYLETARTSCLTLQASGP